MRGTEPAYAGGEPGAGRAPRKRAGRGGLFRTLGGRATIARVPGIMAVADDSLATALRAAVVAGAAVMLAPTSDGGALSVTVFEGDEKSRTYCSSPDEFAEALGAICDQFGTGPD